MSSRKNLTSIVEQKKLMNETKEKLLDTFKVFLNNSNLENIHESFKSENPNDSDNTPKILLIESRDNVKEAFNNHSETRLLKEIQKDLDIIISLTDKHVDVNNKKIVNLIMCLHQFTNQYLAIKDNFTKLTNSALDETIKIAKEKITDFNILLSVAQNSLTQDIYTKSIDKYRGLEKSFREKFYWCLVGLSIASIILFVINLCFKINGPEFWMLKIALILIGITLISYFLKQSIHNQKLADQAYQTQVELQAFPSFTSTLPSDEAAIIRKELALKYFGREINSPTHKDMSNLISDQMKNTTELVKATTDAIKNINRPPSN